MLLPRGFTLKPGLAWNVFKVAASFGLSHVLRRPVVWGAPLNIMMEPISRCNLQCPLCPIGARELKRDLGSMTLANFRSILENVGPQVRVLALWNQGEPTINDELPEMIRFAHERGIYTMTSTNGNLMLRRNLVNRLIDSGLDELIFSIDGLTPESYKIYRIGGELETVVQGMKAVRARRDELKRKTPRIIMQWLPMKHNEHEIPYLRKTAAGWGADSVEIKTTQVYTDQQAADYLPGLESLRRYQRIGERWETKRRYQSCKRLWFSTMIDWNGTVVPCCFDKDEDYPMGNALHQDFREIWHSQLYNDLRTTLIREGRVKEMCQNCTEGLKSYYVPLTKLEKLAEGGFNRTGIGEAGIALQAKPEKEQLSLKR
ncbi:SPASM domain-containing protein [candidate division KSB1 bacterium]|nr:SPASM domain-containing protein [candidate division KSB1 bacterium]